MAILGNNTDHSSSVGSAAGRKNSSQFTLATTMILSELHAWVDGTGSNNFVVHIYTDTAGEPGALIAFTASLAATAVQEISQSGYTNTLTAGNYWLGVTCQLAVGGFQAAASGSVPRRLISSGTSFPVPSNPWGSPTSSSNTNAGAVWAVVNTPVTFVPQTIVIT